MRHLGECKAKRCQWQLLAFMNIFLTAVTRVLPLAGSAGWWITAACVLTAWGLYALGYWGLCRRKISSLPPGCAVCLLAFAASLTDGVRYLTALVTLFTEGVGTSGTQFTLALTTVALLMLALKKEALARGIFFLRYGLAALLMAVLAWFVTQGRVNHLFPLMGNGLPDVLAAFRAGLGMGWPFLLGLMDEPAEEHPMLAPLPPALLGCSSVLCICLAIPHEVLMQHTSLGEALVQTVAYLPSPVRLLAICLWMSGSFLALGSVCCLGSDLLLSPWSRRCAWLPFGLAGITVVTQGLSIRGLWMVLGWAAPFSLAALAVGMLACWRKR